MSKTYYGYIRVSTKEQGNGASLPEQKAAIDAFARRNSLNIVDWFTERQTAAKAGRREFSQMLGRLKKRQADGVIIHKVDRSARNGRDWVEIGDLVDQGIEVRFAHDDLDITTRGGRLTADIQAVIAADFIRNNREEVKKGMYGWLKQGYYPFNAPIGYLNRGKHRLKTVDPRRGPLVVRAFELYGSGQYSLDTLRVALAAIGLTRRGSLPLSRMTVATMLRNPFYYGTIRIQRTGAVFEGAHTPLIKKQLFDRVQAVMDGRVYASATCHAFRFRRLIRCATCPRTLTGELQKGRVYYRCHSCSGVSFCEPEIDQLVQTTLDALRFDVGEMGDLRDIAAALLADDQAREASRIANIDRDLAQVDLRLERLTDAVLDGLIDQEAFTDRKARLIDERRTLLDRRTEGGAEPFFERVLKMFERWNTAQQGYLLANEAEKREQLISLGSNFSANGKELVLSMDFPFSEVKNWRLDQDSGPFQTMVRTDDLTNRPRKPRTRDEINIFLSMLNLPP